MWKDKLGLLKGALGAIALFLSLLIPMYGLWTSTLNEFSRGLLLGAMLVAAVIILIQVGFALWKVDMDSAVQIVIHRLQENEEVARLGKIAVLDREFMQKENYWKIKGGITLEDDYWTFEFWVDALTGAIKKSQLESRKHDASFT